MDCGSEHIIAKGLIWVDGDLVDFVDEYFEGFGFVVGRWYEISDLFKTWWVEVEPIAAKLFDDLGLVDGDVHWGVRIDARGTGKIGIYYGYSGIN